jgi:serine/threonine-protein kinase
MNESNSGASVSVEEGVVSSEVPSSGRPVPISQIPQSLRVGTLIDGRWRLLRVIGVGGTATVYEAEDRSSPTAPHVAVKALHRDCAGNEAIRSRFLREAYLANKVQHPAVVAVLGDGVVDNIPYIVMELLQGETLDARWERKGQRLDVVEVLWAVDKLLDVLVAAHAKGIVHRDIKPENIFLTTDRQLKVLDFGLARLFEGVGYDQTRTQIGFVMGTPAFMPPEQAKGRWDQVGVQTDLWSVGATMFCLLSGRLVHEGSQILEVVEAATTKAAPSLGAVAPEMPQAVVDLVDFALAFEMERRWPNARIMKLAVRKAYVSLSAPEESPSSEQDSTDQLQRSNLVNARGLPSPPMSMRSPTLPRMRPDLGELPPSTGPGTPSRSEPPPPVEAGVPSHAAPVSKSPSVITLPSALGLEAMSGSGDRIPAALPVSVPDQPAQPGPTPPARPPEATRDTRTTANSPMDMRARFEVTHRSSRKASGQPTVWTWLAGATMVVVFLVAAYLVLRPR